MLASGPRAAARDAVARGAVGTAGLNIGATALNFAITVALTNSLGAGGYGAYAFALAWSTTLTVPATLGLSPLIVRTVARYRVESDWGLLSGMLRHSHAVVLLSSALIIALAAAIGAVTLGSRPELLHPFLIALLLVPLVALTTVRQSALQGLGRILLGRIPETLFAPAAFLALVLAGWAVLGDRFSAGAAMLSQVVAGTAAFAIGLWLLRRAAPAMVRSAEPRYERRAWATSAAWLVMMSIASALSTQLAVILLGAFGSSAAAGVYQAVSRVALFVSFLFMAAGYAVGPEIARLHAQGRRDELQALLSRSVRTLFLCCAPIALAFFVFAPQLLNIFGGGFRGGSTVLRILVIGEVIRVGTGYAGTALIVGGHERDMTWTALAGLVLNLALSFALIPLLSGDGAAIAATTALAATQLVTVPLAWRRLRLSSAVIPIPLRMAPSS
jgi:O-antigen/teichoic acid export membrane protein